MKDNQKALEHFNQALNLSRKYEDKIGEAVTLSNIGLIYSNSGESGKALDFYNQALIINKSIDNKSGEAVTLNNIGLVHYSLGKYRNALEFFKRVLLLFITVENKNGEASILNNLMSVWNLLDNQRLAIFCGKQSINKFQLLRGFARSPEIENAAQKSFLKSVNDTYKYLAELLIKQGDYETAVQVLNFYQDQQFFDFDKSSASPVGQIPLSPLELSFVKRFESTSQKIKEISPQLDEIKRQIGNRQSNDEERKKLEELESKLESATNDFLKIFKDAEREFAENPSDKNR